MDCGFYQGDIKPGTQCMLIVEIAAVAYARIKSSVNKQSRANQRHMFESIAKNFML